MSRNNRDLLSNNTLAEKLFPDSSLKPGNAMLNSMMARIKLMITIRTDSLINCLNKLPIFAPNTFLTPTSNERLADFAVERLIKLIHAIINIRMATAVKIYTKDTSLDALIS